MKAAGASLPAWTRFGGVSALGACFYLIALMLAPAAVAFQSTGAVDQELVETDSPRLVTAGDDVTLTITVPDRELDDATVAAAIAQASAIIGDTVWLDADADGVQDAGEAGIAGVTVVLTEVASGAVTTTATNVDGLYLFAALDAGDYRVEINLTTVDSTLTLTTAGSFTITLAANDAFLTADFGLAEELPFTGFDPVPVAAFGLLLALLGAVALELTWPERAGRRLFTMRTRG